MKKSFQRGLNIALIAFTLGACNSISPAQLAETMIAQTAAAVSPTPLPTATATSSPTATFTITPTATRTQKPTRTPTITATYGPLIFTDDLAEPSENWTGCTTCDWQDGVLLMGPYKPVNDLSNMHFTYCKACGRPIGYRMAVDVTYVKGQSDRGFGLVLRDNNDIMVVLEISTYQTLLVGEWDYSAEDWTILNADWRKVLNGLLRAGKKSNHIEVEALPSSNQLTVDYFVNINGKNTFVLFNQPAGPGQVGLELGSHSNQVAFVNFEFEEILEGH